MENAYVIIDGELYHHGIKGMRWGRRRFQNEDGTLTSAGKKRYEGKVIKSYKKMGKAQGVADYYKDKADRIGKKYDDKAAEYETKAKMFEAEGSSVKAAKMRAKAESIRDERKAATVNEDREAAKYSRKADILKAKAVSITTKKNVDIGRAKIDTVLTKHRNKSYNKEMRDEAAVRNLQMLGIGMQLERDLNDIRATTRRGYSDKSRES